MQSAERHPRHQVKRLNPALPAREARINLILDELGNPGKDARFP